MDEKVKLIEGMWKFLSKAYFLFIMVFGSILFYTALFGKKTLVFTNEKIAILSLFWMLIGLFLWLINDLLDMHGFRLDWLKRKGKKPFFEKLVNPECWLYVVIFFHLMVFLVFMYMTVVILSH